MAGAVLQHDALLIGAKIIGLTSAGIFAGYTYCLSRATMPTILLAGLSTTHPEYEKVILSQWRHAYVDGAEFSRICTGVQVLCFGWLAYKAQPRSFARVLYIVAGAMSGSGVPYALTVLRRTNGALSIRARRVVGKFFAGGVDGPKMGEEEARPVAITYASAEGRSVRRDEGREDVRWRDTRALVERWRWHNDFRTVVLVVGTLTGALAVVLDGKT